MEFFDFKEDETNALAEIEAISPPCNPGEIILYPFQADAVKKIEQAFDGTQRRLLLVCPTGGGKTIAASELTKRAIAKHQKVLFLAHRREIIRQTSDKLTRNGVQHGIIMAGVDPRPMASVQVASVDTLRVRALRSQAMKLPPANLLIVDECHHAAAKTWSKLIEAYPDAMLIGMTATPCRGDGRGLGNIFEAMIECPQVAELIEQGYLVKSLVFAPVKEDIAKGVRIQQGDYAVGHLEQRMDREKLVGDIVTHWLKYGDRRRTICFAVSVGHSIHICDEFVKAGVRAEHIDGSTPKDDRDAILARLKSGETEVVTNCMVLTEGFDCPDVGCIILARPTRQMGLYRQMIGRGLRPAPDKTNVVLLDHSGAVWNHGFPEDCVPWSLDPDSRAVAPAHQARLDCKVPGLIQCTQCSALRMGGKPCPNCGFMPKRPAQYVYHREGDLGLVVNGKVRADPMTTEQQLQFYRELRGWAAQRGYSDGWAFRACEKNKGFRAPWAWKDYPPLDPSPTVASWARSRIIAYAKAREGGAE